ATGDGFGKVLRKSRYVRHMDVDVAQLHARPATSNQQRPLQLLAKSGTRSAFDGYLGAISAPASLSPTQLEDFGECPQKFLLKHLLGVTDFDDPERELQIDHREKGIIDHRILERFYRGTRDDELARAAAALPNLPREIVARLEQLVDEQFDEHERVVPPFNRTVRDIERRATKRILREFLANDLADLEAQQLVPRHFEYRFGAKHRELADHPEPFVVDAGGVPVRVEGTIDRIDAGDARFRIVDYKSGKALRHANLGDKIDRGVRLQLALYAMAVSEFFGADPQYVSATIKPIVIGEKSKFAFALHEKRDTLLATLGIFIRAILRGDFPAFPNENDAEFNSCKYCPVKHSCRTKHEPEERYALQQLRDPRTLLGGAQ
ncbi:MAG TPA: PD-(D/E)XK nuclease family protein, partial [Thermoanaerobaculia bacterium]|nr:PD-(D/E)XK nuclease family protein [Thermoanaerobaculia bacterium]